MKWRVILTLLVLGTAAAASPPPNMVIIYDDDMRHGDIGANDPDSRILRPHLNKLAAEGEGRHPAAGTTWEWLAVSRSSLTQAVGLGLYLTRERPESRWPII
ncbi:MAG: hypothetical protein ACKV19_05635 [Verrucomicrobiales bacterium]